MIYLQDIVSGEKILVNHNSISMAEQHFLCLKGKEEEATNCTRIYFTNGNIKYVKEELFEINSLVNNEIKRYENWSKY